VDGAADPVGAARVIAAEVRKYSPQLARKPRWYVLNKIDLIPAEDRAALAAGFQRRLRTTAPVFMVSAATREGCAELVRAVQSHVDSHRASAPAVEASGAHT
jgi:GTPase